MALMEVKTAMVIMAWMEIVFYSFLILLCGIIFCVSIWTIMEDFDGGAPTNAVNASVALAVTMPFFAGITMAFLAFANFLIRTINQRDVHGLECYLVISVVIMLFLGFGRTLTIQNFRMTVDNVCLIVIWRAVLAVLAFCHMQNLKQDAPKENLPVPLQTETTSPHSTLAFV